MNALEGEYNDTLRPLTLGYDDVRQVNDSVCRSPPPFRVDVKTQLYYALTECCVMARKTQPQRSVCLDLLQGTPFAPRGNID